MSAAETIASEILPVEVSIRTRRYIRSGRPRFWTKPTVLPEERDAILEAADKYIELKHRKLVPKLADEWSVSVSPSTVYRVLKEDNQISSKEDTTEDENSCGDYDYTPEEPNECLWQIDIFYIPIVHHEFWYLISALDDYSRRIMSHLLSPTMGTGDLIDVVDNGILDYELAEDPPKFLTDNGTQMTSNRFRDYVEGLEVDHLRAAYNPGDERQN